MKRELAMGVMMVLAASAVHAQGTPGNFEIAGGVRRVGAMSLGGSNANETSPGGGTFTLFKTDSQLKGANLVEGRIGVPFTERLRLEASGSYATSDLSTRITSDVEGIPDVTATEPIQQFTLEGAIVMDLPRWQVGRRTVPLVSAGGGYLRQLHEGQTLIEQGGLFHIGGGANILLGARPDARLKAFGVRLDARALFRTGGVAFDDGAHGASSFGATVFVRF
jgi:hypothetical protein